MPIYEYICNKCHKNFELLIRNNQETIICPYCKKKDVKKLLSTFSFGRRDSKGEFRSNPSKCSGCLSNNCATCH